MSAECEKHGVDLHGHPFSEDGLVCPVCEAEARVEAAERREQTLIQQIQDKDASLATAERARNNAEAKARDWHRRYDELWATLTAVREWRDAKRKHGFKYPALDAILDGEREK